MFCRKKKKLKKQILCVTIADECISKNMDKYDNPPPPPHPHPPSQIYARLNGAVVFASNVMVASFHKRLLEVANIPTTIWDTSGVREEPFAELLQKWQEINNCITTIRPVCFVKKLRRFEMVLSH